MPVYHAVTPGKLKEFKEFQKNLHLAIELFLEVTPGVKNLFLTKWNDIKSTANLADITFRNKSKKLQLKDLLDYWKQIQTVPGFDKYIMFMDNKNNTSGFLYQVQDLDSMRANEKKIGNKTVDTQVTDIIPNVDTGPNESPENGYDNTDKTDDTITTNPKPYKVCIVVTLISMPFYKNCGRLSWHTFTPTPFINIQYNGKHGYHKAYTIHPV